MPRVLISSSTFPLQRNDGLPRFVYDLAEALSDWCEVTALVPAAPGVQQREQFGRVAVYRFPYFIPRSWQKLAYGHGMHNNVRASWLARAQLLPFLLQQIKATGHLVRHESIELINSHWMIPQGLSSAIASLFMRRVPHVLSVHAADIYLLRRLIGGTQLARFIFRHSDAVFSDGSHVRDTLDQILREPSHGVLQPMGVHLNLFHQIHDLPPQDVHYPDGYLVCIGRFVEKKGIRYLLQALPQVLNRYPQLGLILIGYGALEHKLRQEAVQLGVAQAVNFVGRKSHADISRYLRGSRVAVVPSIIDQYGETEGMPTVVIEAMAAGARVVGSAVDGIPDVIRHGENGWLCREKDATDLAEKILQALADPPSTAIISDARETALHFDWSCVAERYWQTFTRLLGTNSTPHEQTEMAS